MRKAWQSLIFSAALCQAQSSCPWLSPATAAGFLSGNVKITVNPDSCRFAGSRSELVIELKTDSCGKDATPLRGIGNEAAACTTGNTEKVVSRVREKHFTVSVTSSDKAVRERAPKIAEQVAGSLF